MTDKLKETVEHAIQELKQVVTTLNGRRVWRGTYWEYTPILPDQYLKWRNTIDWQAAYLQEALREQEAATAKENADVARLEEKCGRLEPVAWIGQRKDGAVELTDTEPTESVRREFNMRPLYAVPPNREWVGLTKEEQTELWDAHIVPVFDKQGINPIVFARMVETKLKEKNDIA